MAIRGQEIVSLIKRQIEEFGGDLTLVDVGSVVQVGDGVASIQGLQGVQSNELLDFGNDGLGVAMNLESDLVGAAILGDPNAVKEGDRGRSTGQIIEVPVGECYFFLKIMIFGVRWCRTVLSISASESAFNFGILISELIFQNISICFFLIF